jgi:acetyltransferase-like isoleucine patch superfamily enzyme
MSYLKRHITRILARLYQALLHRNTVWEYHKHVARGSLSMGRHSYGIPRIDIYKGSEHKVIVGNFVSIAPGVLMITGGIHPTNWVSTFPFRFEWKLPGALEDGMPYSKGDIVIGSDVWIGTDAVILSGVKIGHGAVIATRAVVTKDVPPYAIVAGIPAKVVDYRFDEATIQSLLEIAWWDWDDMAIQQAIHLLSSPDIEEFIHAYQT